MTDRYPGKAQYEGVKPDWDTELGTERDLGFVVVVHNGQTIVAPLHHVRTQIHERLRWERNRDSDGILGNRLPVSEILVNVRGITDHYRVYEGTPEDFVNGTGRYRDETEQQALGEGRKEIEQ